MACSSSSLLKYVKSLPLTAKMTSFKKPLEYIDKKHPSVKERFERLRAKLSSEVEQQVTSASPTVVGSDSEENSTVKRGRLKTKGKKRSEPHGGKAESPKHGSKEKKKDSHKPEHDSILKGRKRKFVVSDSDDSIVSVSPTKIRPLRSSRTAPKQAPETVPVPNKSCPSVSQRPLFRSPKAKAVPMPSKSCPVRSPVRSQKPETAIMPSKTYPERSPARSQKTETATKPSKNYCPSVPGETSILYQKTATAEIPSKSCRSVPEKTPIQPQKTELESAKTKKNAIANRMQKLRDKLVHESKEVKVVLERKISRVSPSKRKLRETSTKDCKPKSHSGKSVKSSLPPVSTASTFTNTGNVENRLSVPFKIPKKSPAAEVAAVLPEPVEREHGEEAMDVDSDSVPSPAVATFDADTVEEMDWEVRSSIEYL